MTTPNTLQLYDQVIKTCEAWTATEDLKWVEGADRRLVSPPRSGGKQGDGEQRSVDGFAVSPAEVREAILWSLDALGSHAAECYGHTGYVEAIGDAEQIREMNETAATHYRVMRTLIALLPEPESDATSHQSPSRTPAP